MGHFGGEGSGSSCPYAAILVTSGHGITAGEQLTKGAVLENSSQSACGAAEGTSAGTVSGLTYTAFTGRQRVFIPAIIAE